jgi:DNA-binding CsgD family transcriptional regulator
VADRRYEEDTFVGRQAELDALRRLLDRAGVGQGRVALLVGEPGVGKTRIAREFAAAGAQRAIVLWGAAYEDWTPPYGPWTQALTPYVEEWSGKLRADAAVLSAVVPKLGDREAIAPSLPSREEQFRLHDAVARALAAADRTVVVVLDDLQWADRASLDLLLAITRSEGGVLVVATMRDDEPSEPLMGCVTALTRERLLDRLQIERFGRDESALLLQRLAGEPVRESLADAIFEQARGNAFFTEELAQHARAFVQEPSAIPVTIRLAVDARVRQLSPEAARVLRLASIFTRPFPFAALRVLVDLPEETVLDALDEALAARLLAVSRAEAESYEFAHDLIRTSLYEELSPSRRARLHRRAAQALEQLGASQPESAAELAVQYHRSATLPGAAHGVGFALAAAEEASSRYAPAEAARFLRIAYDLSADVGQAERASILCRVALAEAESLELAGAQRTAREALNALADTGVAPEETAAFLWALAQALKDAGAGEEEFRPLVEHGLSLVGDAHGLPWARLKLVLRPAERISSGRIVAERWLGYDDDAVRIARGSGDERDYAATLELMDWRDRVGIDALLELCRSWRDPAARIHGLSIAARTLLYNLGAFRDADAVSRELLAESERVGSLTGTTYALEQIADVENAFGDLEAAQATLAHARATAAKLGPAHRVHFIIDFVETRLATNLGGDWAALAQRYEREATDPATAWPWITIQAAGYAAFAYARAGMQPDAIRVLDDLLPLLETFTPTTLNQNGSVGLAGGAIWELRDPTRAERCRTLALALVDAGVGDDVSGSHALTVARTSSLLGDHAGADEWFARAAAELAADGRRPLHAVAAVDQAAAALAARAPVAIAELRAARELADELGMKPVAERATALLEEAEATPPGGLTPREAEILRLLAGGRTNREIADTLVLSVHTIERHLANAYRKIGVRNRAEATAFAVRQL